MTLKTSLVFFPDLRNLCSLIDLGSLCNLNGLNSLYSPISSKNFLILMVWSSLAPQWPILVIFCGMDHQKFNFSLIYGTLSNGGCWGQPMLLFSKTGWWNSNAQTSKIHRYFNSDQKDIFSWPPRSLKYIKTRRKTMYGTTVAPWAQMQTKSER